MKYTFFLVILAASFSPVNAQTQSITIASPDKKIVVTCNTAKALYSISYKGETVLADSKLGVVREDQDFSQNLKVIKTSAPATVKDSYSMLTAKKRNITYTAAQRNIETETASGKKMNIVFQ